MSERSERNPGITSPKNPKPAKRATERAVAGVSSCDFNPSATADGTDLTCQVDSMIRSLPLSVLTQLFALRLNELLGDRWKPPTN